MNAYVYNAALYCESCGEDIISRLESEGHSEPPGATSEEWPILEMQPGESDGPQSCGGCGRFLENPLTPEGRAYVETFARHGDMSATVREWCQFYDIPILDAEDRANLAKFDAMRDDTGKLPACAWPGGYPIVYTFADCAPCCPACANRENGSDASPTSDEDQWRLVGQEIHWEGEPLICEHCGAEIPSAYGPVETAES